MVASTKGRGRGNPGFGSTLSRRGYFSRTHSNSDQPEDSEIRYDVRTSRNKEGQWKTPDEITQDAHAQWQRNNDKVKTALSNSSASQSTPWGTFTKPSSTRHERENIMRVHFQNVRGINSAADFDLWLQAMISMESDYSMLTELNLTRLGTLNHKRIAQDIAPRSKLIQLHPLREHSYDTRRFQKGGSCTWMQPDFVARVSNTIYDTHSRWTATQLCGQSSALTIINAYRTCRASDVATSGSISAREKRSLLNAHHALATNPRKAFLHDLTQMIKDRLSEGHKILLCMDANTTWDHADIKALKADTGLTDLMEKANPTTFPPPATYDRGNDKHGPIDLALGCERTAEALVTAGFHSFYNSNWSDHRLSELCFDRNTLLGPNPASENTKHQNCDDST